MSAAANLVELLRARGLRFAAAYTTTNDAGLRLIERRLVPGDVSALAPWDAPRCVGRAFARWRPAALVLIETELWPALIRAASERAVPVLCASARIYPRDVARYRLIRRFMRPTLERLDAVLAQSDDERARFAMLGVAPERCRTVGNLKHVRPAPVFEEVAAFRRAVGLTAADRVWVAGSLHGDEVALFWAACEHLPERLRRVIVAPRHADAAAALVDGARTRGWALARRSDGARRAWQVLLLDSMGELRAAYAAAAVAVVGGGFAPHGGHDLVEALCCGTPVLFGPHTAHVEPEAGTLRGAVPSAAVSSAEELAARITAWMDDETVRQSILARQRAVLPDGDAIGERYGAAVEPWLQACRVGAAALPSS